jgi:quercetin dioxygenase-like cupin family protein
LSAVIIIENNFKKRLMMKKQLITSVLCFALSACASTHSDKTESITSTQLLKTTSTWDGKAITYPTSEKAQVTALMIEIPVNGETGWHRHPVPSFAMIVEGTLDVMLKNGSVNHLKAGDPLVEVVDTAHNGRNTGTVPVKIMVFYTGTVNSVLTIKEKP